MSVTAPGSGKEKERAAEDSSRVEKPGGTEGKKGTTKLYGTLHDLDEGVELDMVKIDRRRGRP